MRSQLLLVPAAIIASAPVLAEQFLSVEQTQALMFPGETFTPADYALSERQVEELVARTGATVLRNQVRAWRTSGGGWFVLDQVLGRDDRITYAVGLDSAGAVKAIEILVCVRQYDHVRHPKWRRQFVGRKHSGDYAWVAQITNISGATLSVAHIADGVKRVIATHAMFMAENE